MQKSNKLYIVMIIILLVALGIMTYLYLDMRNTAKENLKQVLEAAEENMKLHSQISELEDKNNTNVETNTEKEMLEKMKNNFNNGVDNLDTTIFLKDFENYNLAQETKSITEKQAKEIAQKGFEESAKRITQEGADNIESETMRIMDMCANNYFTAYYAEPSKEYENIKRKCYVFTRENEIGNGIMIYVDMQTGLIIGGDSFGD